MANPSQSLRLSLAATRRLLRARPFSSLQQQPTIRPCLQKITPIPISHQCLQTHQMHTTPPSPRQRKPLAHNREPVPDQPPTTDFGAMDVLANAPVPSTAVEICHGDGFALNSGVRVEGGDGVLLVGGEAFAWRPWEGGKAGKGEKRLVNARGQWEVADEVWGVLGVVWPRPDLLILGLGPEIRPLSPATRKAISALGIRVEVLDTRNAASQYNMLATERGIGDVAAALIPIGWKEGVGAK